MLDKIESICKNLDEKKDRDSNDERLILAFQAGRDKLVNYYQKFNWLYIVSLILDPRHKVSSFDSRAWGKELKVEAIKKFEKIFQKEYYEQSKESVDCRTVEREVEEDCLDFSAIYTRKC